MQRACSPPLQASRDSSAQPLRIARSSRAGARLTRTAHRARGVRAGSDQIARSLLLELSRHVVIDDHGVSFAGRSCSARRLDPAKPLTGSLACCNPSGNDRSPLRHRGANERALRDLADDGDDREPEPRSMIPLAAHCTCRGSSRRAESCATSTCRVCARFTTASATTPTSSTRRRAARWRSSRAAGDNAGDARVKIPPRSSTPTARGATSVLEPS